MPPSLLMKLTSFAFVATAASERRFSCSVSGASEVSTSSKLKRQRNDVVRTGPDQRANERQRRFVGGRDQRRLDRSCAASESA